MSVALARRPRTARLRPLCTTGGTLALLIGACGEARAGGLGAPVRLNAWSAAQAAIGDFDGDGYSDVALGDDSGETWVVHAGSATGLAVDPTYPLPPLRREEGGTPIEPGTGNIPWSAGDLNRDGYDDLFVTAWNYPVRVLFGSASGLREANALELVRPSSLSWGRILATEDLDGDGYREIIVGQYIYRGTEGGPSPVPPTQWKLPGGAASNVRIVGVGDLNGDGFGDLGVLKAGLHICQGGCDLSAIRCVEVDGTPPLEALQDVAGAGDIDGDGLADLVVTADMQVFNDLRQTLDVLHGAAAVFDAPSLTASYTSSLPLSVRFGEGVAGVGDVDCDGFDDVAVGGTRSGTELTLSLYRGSPTGLLDPPAIIGGGYGSPESLYGNPLGGGDFNGDGFRDVFVTGDSFLLGFGDPGATCAPGGAPVRESPPECAAPADDGCSCATAEAPHRNHAPAAALVVLALGARARRRRSRA